MNTMLLNPSYQTEAPKYYTTNAPKYNLPKVEFYNPTYTTPSYPYEPDKFFLLRAILPTLDPNFTSIKAVKNLLALNRSNLTALKQAKLFCLT
ncbi:Uncharacterized protein APZ42_009867 [Daphnia magna]|uniref:Uncharacterized protein n=1 Tax=Daphnia magna TaxID=35525 RepID=A0A164DQU8_9CRUS|nr:Uncharacterized protein APZ42_009867 [Daphnia magna]